MRPSLLLHIPVPWVFVIAYLMGVVAQAFVPIPLSAAARDASNLAGWVTLALGVGLAAWCLTIFRRQRTTTVPGRTSATLVTWGPYRFSRNPMYVALTLAYLGEAGILGQVWPLPVLVLVLVYLNWTLVPFEEAQLQQTFGDAYAAYRARVRRWL
jgi:protein-S-isoprenylcysteine O-methyltransferase Ste14